MIKIIKNYNIVGNKNPNFKTGRYVRIRFCIECKNQITPGSKSGLCKSCAHKGERNCQFGKKSYLGKKHTEETKLKIKLKNLGKKYSKETNQKKGRPGELNPNYINGLSNFPYPLEFSSELKESIRKRDNYECQNCGMTEEEHLIVYGTNLPVHHIDYNKKNCKEDNLITLCLSCNIRANYNRNYWQNIYQNKIKEKNNVYQS